MPRSRAIRSSESTAADSSRTDRAPRFQKYKRIYLCGLVSLQSVFFGL
jgi:hypothetical protein